MIKSTATRWLRYRLWIGVAVTLLSVGVFQTSVHALTLSDALGNNPSGKSDGSGRPLQHATNFIARQQPIVPSVSGPTPECPASVRCVFVPAAYQQDDPADPVNYGNYDIANRPDDGMAINTIVIHDTEGSLQSTLNAFQDPFFYASAHYVIDGDGTIYQMVQTKNVAWHAGNWWINMHSIGIEHVGHAVQGRTEYTAAMYKASNALVKYLTDRYHIPLDRQHIIGHDNVPAPSSAQIPAMHWDPGPFWNWQHYMSQLGAPVSAQFGHGGVVTVAPNWQLNHPAIEDCSSGTCTPLPAQPANFAYLRTAPDTNAPFVADPVLGQGTLAIDSVAAKAYFGQQFVAIQTKWSLSGLWTQVWYDGQTGWILSPWNAPNLLPGSAMTISPKPSLNSIPVYGRAYPEAAAYPAGFAGAQPVVPLSYTIARGQHYSVVGGLVPTDYYYAQTFNSSLPFDHTDFTGTDQYIRIQFNGREAFVRKADVNLTH